VSVPPGGATPRTVAASAAKGIVSHIDRADIDAQLRNDALEGLTSVCKSLPSKWFYDETGSQLFEEITHLPEYYLTRTERRILLDRADAIAKHTGADTLVELGSGTSEKTCILLDAFRRTGHLRRFVPFDVDADTLSFAAAKLLSTYSEIEVRGICGDFERHLDTIAQPGRSVVAFLGSTIGNLDPLQRASFFDQLASSLKPGDSFLVGIDLVKDVDVLEAAYNDSRGVSADFNLNILSVLNKRLDADFDLSRFGHLARFNRDEEWMDMWLRSTQDQLVRLGAIELEVSFEEGELLHTEISAKFRKEGFEQELSDAGLEPTRWWTDAGQMFALSLSYKP
jgi:L-histidine Nalpha-methyltransferase